MVAVSWLALRARSALRSALASLAAKYASLAARRDVASTVETRFSRTAAAAARSRASVRRVATSVAWASRRLAAVGAAQGGGQPVDGLVLLRLKVGVEG